MSDVHNKVIQSYIRAVTRPLIVSAIRRLDAHEKNYNNVHNVTLDQVVKEVSLLPPNINTLNEGDWYIQLINV